MVYLYKPAYEREKQLREAGIPFPVALRHILCDLYAFRGWEGQADLILQEHSPQALPCALPNISCKARAMRRKPFGRIEALLSKGWFIMSQIKTYQHFVFKLHTQRLKKAGWSLS